MRRLTHKLHVLGLAIECANDFIDAQYIDAEHTGPSRWHSGKPDPTWQRWRVAKASWSHFLWFWRFGHIPIVELGRFEGYGGTAYCRWFGQGFVDAVTESPAPR